MPEILVTRDIKFANLIVDSMLLGSALSGTVLIREQSLEAIRDVWSEFLLNPIDIHGIVILRKGHTRYRYI